MDKIKNLSIRKTIVLYMAVSLLLCFLLYAVIVWIATEVQNQVWWRYVDEKEYFEMVKGVAYDIWQMSQGQINLK